MTNTGVLAFLVLTFGIASARKCQNITVPVTLSARQGIFNISAPASDIDVTNFILDDTRQGTNYTKEVLSGVCVVLQLNFKFRRLCRSSVS